MASRRNRPTLYEVVHHHRRQPVRSKPAEPVVPPIQPAPVRAATRDVSKQQTAPPPPIVSAAPPETELAVEPIRATAQPAAAKFRWLNGVLEMQLPAPWLIVGVVALAAIFGLGLHSGSRIARVAQSGDPRDDLALLTAQPADPALEPAERPAVIPERRSPAPAQSPLPRRQENAELAAPLPSSAVPQTPDDEVKPQTSTRVAPPVATPPRPAKEIEWLPGKYYIVVQHFRNDATRQAEEAQQFLSQNGIEAVLLRGSDTRLIVSQPFDSKPAADATLNNIRKLGQRYSERGYTFADCYVRMFKRAS